MSKNYEKSDNLMLKIIVAIVLLAVFLVPVIFSTIERHDAANKEMLSQAISTFPIPINCSEIKRSYQRGDLDAISTWTVNYGCNTTLGAANSYIVSRLEKNGFKNGWPSNYLNVIEYGNQNYDVKYNLNVKSLTGRVVAKDDQINSIDLIITRAHAPISPSK